MSITFPSLEDTKLATILAAPEVAEAFKEVKTTLSSISTNYQNDIYNQYQQSKQFQNQIVKKTLRVDKRLKALVHDAEDVNSKVNKKLDHLKPPKSDELDKLCQDVMGKLLDIVEHIDEISSVDGKEYPLLHKVLNKKDEHESIKASDDNSKDAVVYRVHQESSNEETEQYEQEEEEDQQVNDEPTVEEGTKVSESSGIFDISDAGEEPREATQDDYSDDDENYQTDQTGTLRESEATEPLIKGGLEGVMVKEFQDLSTKVDTTMDEHNYNEDQNESLSNSQHLKQLESLIQEQKSTKSNFKLKSKRPFILKTPTSSVSTSTTSSVITPHVNGFIIN